MNEKVRDLFWKDPLSLTQAEIQRIILAYREYMADREMFNLKTGERKKQRRVKRVTRSESYEQRKA